MEVDELAEALAWKEISLESPEPIFLTDSNHMILLWNPAAAALFGISASQALGRPCWAVIGGRAAPGDVLCCRWNSSSQPISPPTERWTARGKRGRTLQLKFHFAVFGDKLGRPRAVLHLVERILEVREPGGQDQKSQTPALAPVRQGPSLRQLTRRERQVFRLLVEGQTARGVAAKLGIQHATARNHIQRILSKFGAHNRIEALANLLTGATSVE